MEIGVVGVGEMGRGVAHNLIKSGHRVRVYDLDTRAVAELVALGAVASSLSEIGTMSEVIHVTVLTDAQTREVVLGADDMGDGVLRSMQPGSVIMLHSTIKPATCVMLSELAAPHRVDVVDAGMTGGGGMAAQNATLRLLVGGDEAVVDRLRPELEAIAVEVTRLGGVGAGMAAKILNNFVALVNAEALREAFLVADHLGIDVSALGDVFSRTTARSWSLENWDYMQMIVESTVPRERNRIIVHKDISLAFELAPELNGNTPMMAVARDRQRTFVQALDG
jgi:3-hydroxyisobutyrate dehydrogenase